MLSPKLRADIRKIWDRFWSDGIANPLTAIEQITYLVFLKRLEDLDIKRVQADRARTRLGVRQIARATMEKGQAAPKGSIQPFNRGGVDDSPAVGLLQGVLNCCGTSRYGGMRHFSLHLTTCANSKLVEGRRRGRPTLPSGT